MHAMLQLQCSGRHGGFCIGKKHLACISESLKDFAAVDGPGKFQEGRDSFFQLFLCQIY
jgi:hypothetical protein